MKEKTKLLLSGPGLIGKKHAELIIKHADCSLEVIVVPENSPDRNFFASLPSRIYSDIEAALENEEVSGAIISSPNPFHYTQAQCCLAKGIPTLVEKPVTDNLEDAYKLVVASEKTNIPVLVGHHRTYSPLLASAYSFLNSDKFGRMVAVQGSALFYKPAQYFIDGPWRTKLGGGPILINLIHEIGLLRYFCGEIERIFAFSSEKIRNFTVEDTVTISIEFKNGTLGNFLLSDTAASNKSWEMTSGENPIYPYFPEDNCYHFAGTNGSLDFPTMKYKVYADEGSRSWTNAFREGIISTEKKDPLELQLDHFINVINKTAKPMVSARDGYMNMVIIKAIEESILSGNAVTVDHK